MAVTIDEMAGSPTGRYNVETARAEVVRNVKVAWTDRDTYVDELVPPPIVAGNTIVQQPTAQLFPGSFFRVVDFEWTPMFDTEDGVGAIDSDGLLTYDSAKFTITYAVPERTQVDGDLGDPGNQPLNYDPVLFLKHDIKHGGKFFKIPTGSAAWESDDQSIPENVPLGIFIGTTQHNVMWPGIFSPNWSNLESFKGGVNTSTFRLRGYAYPAQTLLYIGYDGEETVMSDGTLAWSITLHFESEQKPVEHTSGTSPGGYNHFWREDTFQFELMYAYGTTYPYIPRDFTQLFTAGS